MSSSNRLRRALCLAILAVMARTAPAFALSQSSLANYTEHLQKLHTLIQSCEANASACNPSQTGSDETVTLQKLNAGANIDHFDAHYDWLRNALKQAQNVSAKNRDQALKAADQRVQQELQEAGQTTAAPSDFHQARTDANTILSHPEFVTVEEQSIWDKLLARFFLWLNNLFSHVAQFGQRSPWIGPLLEWGFLALALIGLSLWAMRVFQRQRLKVKIETARQIEPWEEASRNWRSLAAEQAAQQDWREAVHCLYWASIVMLEGRRFWAPSRSRTPREYIRLLEAGSQRWTLLKQQTSGFERIWYGLRPAEQQDYQAALDFHEQLRSA
jgi:hypothetical protein